MSEYNVKKGSDRINARAYGAVKNFERKMIKAVIREQTGPNLTDRLQAVFGVFAASPKTDFTNTKHVNEFVLGSVYGMPFMNSRGVLKDLPAFGCIPLATSIEIDRVDSSNPKIKLVYDLGLIKDFKLGHYVESYKERIRIFFKNCVLTNFFRSSIDCQSETKVVLTLRMTLVEEPLYDLRKSYFVGSREYYRFDGALESADVESIKKDLSKMLTPKPVIEQKPDPTDEAVEFYKTEEIPLIDILKQTKEKMDKNSTKIISEIENLTSQIKTLEAMVESKRSILNRLRIITDKSVETIKLLGDK